MKFLLDTRWYSDAPSGVGMYVKNIMVGLMKHPEIQTTFFGNVDGKQLPNHINHISFNGLKKKLFQGLWKTIKFPSIEVLVGENSLVHYTNATAIPQRNGKYILTIHDLAYIDFPETIEDKNLLFLQKNVYNSAKNAKHIVAVSDYTKNKIAKEFSISPTKITTIYNGIDKDFFIEKSQQERSELRIKYNLDKQYILSVSTIEPRKDFITQIKAYKMLPQSLRDEFDLVIAGGKGWKSEGIFTEAEKELQNGNIRLLGYVDEADLPCLMQEASLYLHTSLDEGFGISIVQALASRLRVVASNTSCHPEILQNHGTYFEVSQPQDLAAKIEETLSFPPNQADLNKASVYAQNFTWEKMQSETIHLYKKMM